MLKEQARPEFKQMQKPSFSTTFSKYSKKLIIGTIITSLAVSTLLPSLAWAKSKKTAKAETYALATDGKNDNKLISAQNKISINAQPYLLKCETEDDWKYIKYYFDETDSGKQDISKFIKENFSGKFTNREIIIGNPSFIIKGVDGNGNYCYLLHDTEKAWFTPITSGFNAGILNKLGVEVKCIFDEDAKTWRISYQKDEKELHYGVLSEEGKLIDAKDLGLDKVYSSSLK
jgi:hypothetical protein